jgi:hypothetical protein
MGRIDLGAAPPFVSWIGVTPYLSEAAILTTLGALLPCTLVTGYCIPTDSWGGKGAAASTRFLRIAEQSGEAITSFFSTEQFETVLSQAGFELLDDVGAEAGLETFGVEAWALGYERLALARKAN